MNKHSELVINGEKQESSEDETTDVSDIWEWGPVKKSKMAIFFIIRHYNIYMKTLAFRHLHVLSLQENTIVSSGFTSPS
jgi:hypothetical protein